MGTDEADEQVFSEDEDDEDEEEEEEEEDEEVRMISFLFVLTSLMLGKL